MQHFLMLVFNILPGRVGVCLANVPVKHAFTCCVEGHIKRNTLGRFIFWRVLKYAVAGQYDAAVMHLLRLFAPPCPPQEYTCTCNLQDCTCDNPPTFAGS